MPKLQALAAGLLLSIIGSVVLLHESRTPANDTLDPIVTGSVRAEATQDTKTQMRGSAAFRVALALLDEGEAEAAFDAANALSVTAERHAVQWAAIRSHPGDIDADTIRRFADETGAMLPPDLAARRIEQSLLAADASDEPVLEALGGSVPQTIDGKIRLAEAVLASGDSDRAAEIIAPLWINSFLSREQEAIVTDTFGSLLTADDHWSRAERLLMHDRIRPAERLAEHFDDAQNALIAARAATARGESNGRALLDALDESMHEHPVYIFTRVQRARAAGLYDQAVDWLERAPSTVPEPAVWWTERNRIARTMLGEGESEAAYRAIAGFVEGPEGRLVDAHFMAGWIALAFLDDAERARQQFEAMAGYSTVPGSITQAHYWLGRALTELGEFALADRAYGAAAEHYTVYYGQLARQALGLADVPIRPLPSLAGAETLFEAAEPVRAVRLLAANDERDLALVLLRQYAETLTRPDHLMLAARLAVEYDAPNIAIAIAEAGRRKGIALDTFAFPTSRPGPGVELAADRAAVLAVARQESLFRIDAVSHAGARGLMQLMPGTARETAERLGLDYSPGRLTSDPAYNALLGSTYLSQQLERFDDSLVLAAAAYNAGPGNASKWIDAYGDPRALNVDPVIWIELIPFDETRHYVQRVLGNYLVYRSRLGKETVMVADAMRRIP